VAGQIDVAVIGAGFAGLTAARELTRAGASCVVLEARERVGGRVHDRVLADGTVLELGGQWVGPTQDRILGLLAELGIGTEATPTAGDALTIVGDARHRHQGELPDDLGPGVRPAIDAAFAALDDLGTSVPLDAPWDAPGADRLDHITMDTWLANNVDHAEAHRFLFALVESLFVRPPVETSMLDFLVHTRAAGSLIEAMSVEGGTQQARIAAGPQAVTQRLADEFGDRVVLGSPVWRIRETARGVAVDTAGVTYEAERVIVAMAPLLASRILVEPPVTTLRDGLAHRMPHGSVIKIQALYREPFWRADGLSGTGFSTDGPVSYIADGSPVDGHRGVLVGFIESRQARALADASEGRICATALDGLAAFVGDQARSPDEVHIVDWSADPWTRGCYSGHVAPGAWTSFGPALRQPCGRIHWAGTETAVRMCGYIDGAVESGRRAAAEVLAALGSIARIRP